jgi:Flagellar motor switch protein
LAKRKLSGLEKAAIFIAAVGPDVAAEILKQLDIKEVGVISSLIAQMGEVSTEEIDEVLGGVLGRLQSDPGTAAHG